MDLLVCGSSPLIQPPACPRYYDDKPNPCSHVSSGQVDANSQDKACPNMAITPRAVFSNQQRIDVRRTGIENVLTLRSESEIRVVHCRDGYDRTMEKETIPLLRDQVSDDNQQDIWVDTKMTISEDDDDDDDFGDDMFGNEYPRGPVVELGLLHRNGAIYSIKQQPFSLKELTNSETRTPFLHAIFRQECNNGKRDVWPAVVLPQQPSVLYRLRTVHDLLTWLDGQEVQHWRLNLSSPIVSLCASRSRADHCVAVTECGKVYHWKRSTESAGSLNTSTRKEALSAATTNSDPHAQEQRESGYLNIPATDNVALGLWMGAAVTRTGLLYVFSLRRSTTQDLTTPHIIDLDDGTQQHRIPGPFLPKLAGINSDGVRFVDVAAGEDHLVALTSEGEVFTVGSGFQGALGIGQKQFELDDLDPKAFEWTHECAQFSEDWQLMVKSATNGQKTIVKVSAGYQSTIMITKSGQVE